MFVGQRSLQYRPDTEPVTRIPPWLAGVQHRELRTSDGERIAAWWAPPREADGPVVLYLHGNGGSLRGRDRRYAWLRERGFGLLAVSWRGYGGSSGTPTEAGLLADARAGWDAIAAEGVLPARVVVFGESLGTTVAVILAAEVRPAAVVLDSAFSSVLDVAGDRYWWLPVSLLLKDTLRADLAAPRLASPVLQVHCRVDPVTPRPYAERLHALLPRAEPLVTVEDRCHTPSLARWERELAAFLERHAAR